MDEVDYEAICKLAREEAAHAVQRLAQDRMLQGEALEDKGLLSLIEEDRDNEIFGAFESYLNYIHYIIQETPIPLHV